MSEGCESNRPDRLGAPDSSSPAKRTLSPGSAAGGPQGSPGGPPPVGPPGSGGPPMAPATSPSMPSVPGAPCHPGPPVDVTIRTMMAGANNTLRLIVPAACPIGHIKQQLADRLDIVPERQLLFLDDQQLDNNMATLPEFGVTDACNLMMHLKLSAGTSKQRSANEVICFVPNAFPNTNEALRNAIRGMTSGPRRNVGRRRDSKPLSKDAAATTAWTPQKENENALTRNRMKSLLKSRKKQRSLLEEIGAAAGSMDSIDPGTPDHGSILGSAEHSAPPTPPSELSTSGSVTTSATSASSTSGTSLTGAGKEPVLEKELRMYFDAPETRAELEALRTDFTVPPSTYEEHQLIKLERDAKEKTRCKMCKAKLKLADQSLLCACNKAFCRRHRAAKDHNCAIDYKQTGRDKISKDNPKVYDGGNAKGKLA